MTTSIIYEPKGRAREYAALAANLYSGCQHGCKYCYAPKATFKDRVAFHGNVGVRHGIMAKFEADCRELRGSGKQVLLSFTTDPYGPIDMTHKLTRRAVELLHDNGLFVEILTKGGMRAARDFDLLGSSDAFATTMTFLDEERSRQWEPEAALPEDRIQAIKMAHAKDIPTWVSLEPVIDPETSLEIIRRTYEYVSLYKVGTLNYDARAKAINWADFGQRAIDLLESLGKAYYIKNDLREKIPDYGRAKAAC